MTDGDEAKALDPEEEADAEAFDQAVADPMPHIPWEQVKVDLGLVER